MIDLELTEYGYESIIKYHENKLEIAEKELDETIAKLYANKDDYKGFELAEKIKASLNNSLQSAIIS